MKRKKRWFIWAPLLLGLVLFGTGLAAGLLPAELTLAQGASTINWPVVAGGGGSSTAGTSSMDDTIGQWLVGSDQSGTSQLNSGFVAGLEAPSGSPPPTSPRVFLPVVLK